MPTPQTFTVGQTVGGTPIDVVQVDAGAGTVDRQVVALGDATTGNRYVTINSDGTLSVRSNRAKGTAATSRVDAATTATLLIAANTSRKSVTIENAGSAPVYLGPTNAVTVSGATAGLRLDPGAVLIDEDTTGAWYGIVSSGTVDVRVIEVA